MNNGGIRFTIISGLSGAGKTIAMHALEDIGFYCVDNLPIELLPSFYDLSCHSEYNMNKAYAVVVDTRGGNVNKLFATLEQLKSDNKPYTILFLDAKMDVLARRFQQTRRKHPLLSDSSGSIEKAIEEENMLLKPLKNISDYAVDTTYISPMQLKDRVTTIFLGDNIFGMNVTCMSFGFKYGVPNEADLIFDVRCLVNPFYIPELKYKTGNDKEVYDYVMDNENSKGLFKRIADYVDYSLPLYADEGKSQLTIALGCTGGKHRSVTFARALCEHLKHNGQQSSVYNRDINKE